MAHNFPPLGIIRSLLCLELFRVTFCGSTVTTFNSWLSTDISDSRFYFCALIAGPSKQRYLTVVSQKMPTLFHCVFYLKEIKLTGNTRLAVGIQTH